jgi:hypothetical protein
MNDRRFARKAFSAEKAFAICKQPFPVTSGNQTEIFPKKTYKFLFNFL